MITSAEFIHPEDAAALQQMENIPGFPTLVKKILSLGYEQLQYGVNMASNIRLSETQLPKIYHHLPPICEKLGIEEVGTHTLRKTFGYWHYQQYKDVAILQEIFNHSAPSITLRYIGINADIIDSSIDNFYL